MARPPPPRFQSGTLAAPDAPVALAIDGLSGPGFSEVSLQLRAGEILGLAGLIGAGRTELARAAYRALRVSGGPSRHLMAGRWWAAAGKPGGWIARGPRWRQVSP